MNRLRSENGFDNILCDSYLDSDDDRVSCSRAPFCESDVTFLDKLSRMPLDGPAHANQPDARRGYIPRFGIPRQKLGNDPAKTAAVPRIRERTYPPDRFREVCQRGTKIGSKC